MNIIKTIFKNTGSRIWFIVTIVVLALLITATILLSGILRSIVGTVLGGPGPIQREGVTAIYKSDYDSKQASKEAGDALNVEIAEEGFTLLSNEGNVLPLRSVKSKNDATASKPKISVFGKNSTNLVLSGSGSGGITGESAATLYVALEDGGYEINPTLKSFYEGSRSGSSRSSNPATASGTAESPTLDIGETPRANYGLDEYTSMREYKDAAIVVISRIGGESFDLPRTQNTNAGGIEGNHYLQLDNNEYAMLDVATSRFSKVIVVLNTLTSFQCDFMDEYNNTPSDPRIDALVWIGGPGANGIMAFGNFLNGNITPSGKTTDIYVKDFTIDPTWQNFGDNSQIGSSAMYTENGENVPINSYIAYNEGVYMGYRYYETRGYEEFQANVTSTWYEDTVRFPFGYGLSYTNFEQTMSMSGTLNNVDSELTISVTVKNTGDIAGRDVVQLYVKLPYQKGGIEKSYVQLVDFAKTDVLLSGSGEGSTQSLTFKVSAYDLASYDYNDANDNMFKGYELDPGIYEFVLGKNSHVMDSENVYASSTVIIEGDESIKFDKDPTTKQKVENLYTDNEDIFDDSDYRLQDVNITNAQGDDVSRKGMSRTDFNDTFPINDADREYFEGEKAAIANVKHNNTKIESISDMPIQGIEGTITLRDMLDENGKVSYGDTRWKELLDRLTVDEMISLVNEGAFNTVGIPKIGKNLTNDSDGPLGFVNFMPGLSSSYIGNTRFSCQILIAATWSKDLAYRMGRAVGDNGVWGDINGNHLPYTGWYAPAVNLHRSPFSGRNYEYYSEDPVLSGKLAVNVINGGETKGVYTDLKHFALNDQETNRAGVATFVTEQALRELYLKPFEIAVKGNDAVCASAAKDGVINYVGSKGMMSSFNRIGTKWTGGDYRLMTQILRDEWGFRGLVICDYKTDNYMNSRQMLYAGNDLILTSMNNLRWNDVDASSAWDVTILRTAAHNILYVVANSNSMNVDIVGYNMEWWLVLVIIIDCVAVVSLGVWGFFAIRRGLKKTKKQQPEN